MVILNNYFYSFLSLICLNHFNAQQTPKHFLIKKKNFYHI